LAQIGEVFPIVVANIEARVLMPMAAALCARLAPGGLLILSGVLAGEEPEVRGHFVATVDGLEHCGTDRRDEGDDAWTALCFRASRGRASAGPASGGATGDG
jgi:ribosomal protein L11 methyltransferase